MGTLYQLKKPKKEDVGGGLITSRKELHDEVEVDGVLEGVEHLDHPLMVRLHQDVPLSPHVGHLWMKPWDTRTCAAINNLFVTGYLTAPVLESGAIPGWKNKKK